MIGRRFSPSPSFDDWGVNIVFYCKDCERIVEARKFGRKYVYKCKDCGTKNVAFGTSKSIKKFFRIEEEEKAEKK